MRDLIAAHARRGGTVLVSTHVLAEVELVADRVVVLARGRVVASGSVPELMAGDGADAVLEVACDDPARLAEAIGGAGGTARRPGDAHRLEVSGLTARDLAVVARGCDVLVWTLTPRRRSMEEYFLQTVGGASVDGLLEEAPCSFTS
jgi:ABC-2 type transport system ATP-binding protein